MVKTIAIVPLRGGSKSIPLKNIKVFFGKPLCFWVLQELQNSIVDEVYVATDSKEISDVVNSFNLSKVKIYNRDPINAQDTSSTESVMLEFINKMNLDYNNNLMLVQATSPFTKAKDFNEALALLKKEEAESLLTAVRTKRFFWTKEGQPINYDYNNRPRRQDFEGMLMENGAFYINSVKNIIENKNRLSCKIAIYEMQEHTALEIDEELDWILAEHIMAKYI